MDRYGPFEYSEYTGAASGRSSYIRRPEASVTSVERYDPYPYQGSFLPRYRGRPVVSDGPFVPRSVYPSAIAGGYDDEYVTQRTYTRPLEATRSSYIRRPEASVTSVERVSPFSDPYPAYQSSLVPGRYRGRPVVSDGPFVQRSVYPSVTARGYYGDVVTQRVYPSTSIVTQASAYGGAGAISEGELQQRFREQHPYMFKPDGTLKSVEELHTACTKLDSLIKSGLSISAAASALTSAYNADGASSAPAETAATPPQALPDGQAYAPTPAEQQPQQPPPPVEAAQPLVDAWAQQVPPAQWAPQPTAPIVDQTLVDQWAAQPQVPATVLPQAPVQWVPQPPVQTLPSQWAPATPEHWAAGDAWASQPQQQWVAPASVAAQVQGYPIQKAAPASTLGQMPLPPMDSPDEEPPAVTSAHDSIPAVPEAPAVSAPPPASAPAAPEERPSRGGGFDLERSKRIAEQLLAS
eukprot:GGOE01063520.1.p1 GENE.GGOE01063520.1~~GGOE01063520.1.p1  ORF type:complete len:465 (-),score=37.42 GGOE01063520.1:304-1698(-)